MKILHIMASMDPKLGGVCQALKTMVAGLNQTAGIINEIVSFDKPDASFIDQNLCTIHALGAGKGPWFQNAAYVPWLLQNLAGFDVVILHGLWNYQGFGLNKAFRKLKQKTDHSTVFSTRFFVMPHGMLDPYFQKAKGRKIKAIRNWFYWKIIEQKIVNRANGLLFTCEAEKLLAKNTFSPYLPEKELVVGLGVDEPPAFTANMQTAFSNHCSGLAKDPYLLFISRIHEKKGVDLLIDAYSNLDTVNSAPDKNLANSHASFTTQKLPKLVIAGPGLETAYGQKMKLAAVALQPQQPLVYFPGMLTGDAKWGAFYGSEAFILPSHQENFGIAVVEALACGKPVLISNQINIHKEISNAEAGFVAEDTVEGAAQLLLQWNSLSSEEKTRMGINARKCYEMYFAVAAATQHLLAAITLK